MFRKKTTKKSKAGVSKYFDSRRGAYREFKQDYDIPNSEQAQKVITPNTAGGENYGLDERNKRLYIFEEKKNRFGIIKRKETHLREDKNTFYAEEKGKQDQHFNAGYRGEKLKDHYYFKKKKK